MEQHNWNNVLTPGEEIKLEFGPGEHYLQRGFYIGITLGIISAILIIGIFVFFYTLIYFKFYLGRAFCYAFTNKRVLVHRGWIFRNLTSIEYTKITDVQVRENSIEQWLFKTGSVIINTAGSDKAEVVLDRIENPHFIKQQLETFRSEYANHTQTPSEY